MIAKAKMYINVPQEKEIEVLIAEDSPTQAEQLRALLERNDYRVMIAADGEQALALARQRRPDLIISDILMPKLSGYELCRKIKSDEDLRVIPVILVTTLSDVLDIMKGLECGADNFIRKPYEEKYLIARVQYLLMNGKVRQGQKMQMGMEILLGGQKHFISAERQQIMDLLISVYEEAVHVTDELRTSQQNLANTNRALTGLYNLAQRLSRAVTEQDVCDKALESAMGLVGAKAGWIALLEPTGGFGIGATRSLTPAMALEGCCECLRRLQASELKQIEKIRCERLIRAADGGPGPTDHASVPLWIGDRVVGVMNLVLADEELLESSESEVLYGIGHQVGIALERVRIMHDLVAARQEADTANRAKSNFLASMSHEIRTPMNGVIGMVDVLHQTSLQGYQVEMVDLIRESAFSLLAIIDDILDFSKIEAGKLVVETAPISIVDVVEKSCGMLDHLAARKGVELTLFTDPNIPPTLLGDALRLRQIIINLANNAIKFSSGQERVGRVSVRALLKEDMGKRVTVEFRVIDNGIGISQDAQTRLFSQFVQADTSTTRRFGGTGLGLAISRHLTTLMGGDISLRSDLGIGSEFTVRLPFDVVIEEGKSSEEFDLTGLQCLVIADGGGLGDDLNAYLKHSGAEVERAYGFEEALQRVAVCAPGALMIIIDSRRGDPQIDALRDACLARENMEPHFVVLEHGAHRPGVEPHFVVVKRGRRRKGRVEAIDRVTMDGDVLRQRAFIKAVAIAAGRCEQDSKPLATQPDQLAVAPSREEAIRQGRLILVAEDNETNQEVTLRQLSLLGYAADVASNGDEALQRWQSGDYSLLLTDLHMPKMDGYQLAAAIRVKEAGTSRMPIVVLTANAIRGEKERCLAAGMDDYISKPAKLADLRALLAKWLPLNSDKKMMETPSTKVPDSQGHEVLDSNVLKELVGDDPGIVDEFLASFKQSASNIAKELIVAYDSGSIDKTSSLAHKLKSSAFSVGARRLGKLCADIEFSGRHRKGEGLNEMVSQFKLEFEAVNELINAKLRRVQK